MTQHKKPMPKRKEPITRYTRHFPNILTHQNRLSPESKRAKTLGFRPMIAMMAMIDIEHVNHWRERPKITTYVNPRAPTLQTTEGAMKYAQRTHASVRQSRGTAEKGTGGEWEHPKSREEELANRTCQIADSLQPTSFQLAEEKRADPAQITDQMA